LLRHPPTSSSTTSTVSTGELVVSAEIPPPPVATPQEAANVSDTRSARSLLAKGRYTRTISLREVGPMM
jgi:hypothetical protein